ncbi:MAG: MG2 domain-containing protein [Planctomycetota bacterium]|nr:MG2 domain-containing protein [Planctomycetota bacterium]
MPHLSHSQTPKLLFLFLTLFLSTAFPEADIASKAVKLYRQGNYKEALAAYRELLLDPKSVQAGLPGALNEAVQCMSRINQFKNRDEFLEKTVETHPENWRLLQAAANQYFSQMHYGYILSGKFERGWRRGGGRYAHVQEQDRQRALQLMKKALDFINQDLPSAQLKRDRHELAAFAERFSQMLLGYRGMHGAWRLQYLTDLETPPDFIDTTPAYHGYGQGASVDADGKPVLHKVPPSFDEAKTDGERWRAMQHAAFKFDPQRRERLQLAFADFMRNQFGVQTASSYAGMFGQVNEGEGRRFSVESLKENETIAKLATGVQRFELPDEYNFIKIYQELGSKRPPKTRSPISDLTYKYYEGNWDQLPDFGKLTPVGEGKVTDNIIDVGVSRRADLFGLVFEGKLNVPGTGRYRFNLYSDDGATLAIGKALKINNDGLHGIDSGKSVSVNLQKGTYPIRIEFFEKNGDEGINLSWSGPGVAQQFLSPPPSQNHPPEQAMDRLARVFENRRQYPKAAEIWAENIEHFGPGHKGWKRKRRQQIVGNLGRFEPTQSQPARQPAKIEYRFRNGTEATFTAHTVKIKELLADVRAYLKSNPKRHDWGKSQIRDIGRRLVHDNQTRYLGAKVAEWKETLKPAPRHHDRRIEITTPLKDAGAYLLKGTMKGGNTSQIMMWLDDTLIVKKPLDGEWWYYVADAITGQPIPGVKLNFFGYRRQWRNRTLHTETKEFSAVTNSSGQLILKHGSLPQNMQWMVTADDDESRFAHLGYFHTWQSRLHDPHYNQMKVFGITDRPVYRPEQPVRFKFWVRQSRYDLDDKSLFANRAYVLKIQSPKGKTVHEKTYTTDEYGGIHSKWDIPKDASLGAYYFQLRHPDQKKGHLPVNMHFRIEEYKKPEFEVKVEAPSVPVRLGEKVTATIEAKYLFGAPVTNARVKYKILRNTHSDTWYPRGDWDWFYGRGYWWFAEDYNWYPGFHRWGCEPPTPWWWRGRSAPPELVAETTVEINEEGKVEIEIDTAIAAELHGDTDHRYSITAEVTDKSRRTIVGSGSVLVTREAFKVYAWLDRGHYKAGDTVEASLNAQTPDGKPVKGKGELKLLSVTYENEKPKETVIERWDLDPGADGRANQKFIAAKPGQYRISYRVTDAKQHTIEGGYLFVVRGGDFNGRGYRFHHLELLTDRREYNPGNKVNMLVNTNREGGTVALFVRPSNGVYLRPEIISLKGKFEMRELTIAQKDMPNFFVEAITVANGKIHRAVREVIVPPAKRILNLDVQPSKTAYKPGEDAKVKVKITDEHGQPYTGSAVLAVYDRAVEYISGGSNVAEIRSHFWKWRRHHNPNEQDTLKRHLRNLVPSGMLGMSNIGAFGHLTTPDDANGVAAGDELSSFNGRAVRTKGHKAFAEAKMDMDEAEESAPQEGAEAGNALGADAKDQSKALGGGGGGGQPTKLQPVVRKNFADTAFWAADIVTDSDGLAEVSFKMPENLTGWKVRAWGMGHGTRVGEASAEIVTRKDVLLRLQAPRFFVERDEVVLSANIHNYLDSEQEIDAILELKGGALKALGKATQTITLKPKGEQRVDWRVKAVSEGEAVVVMKALGQDDSDAMEQRFPVLVHGMLKTVAYSAVVRPEEEVATLTIEVPKERRPDQTHLELRYSPSLAASMVDALPYLVEYPYGCTEQTLNRFLPTVITQKVLMEMGLDLASIRNKRTNLNAQELGDDKERAKQWKRYKRNPVFDEAEVEKMVTDGVKRLTNMQNRDGGWGWFSSHRQYSYPHTTATVVHGFLIARDNDVKLDAGIIHRGVDWLARYQTGQVTRILNHLNKVDTRNKKSRADDLDALVYSVLSEGGRENKKMAEFLYRDRLQLSTYSQAMVGLAFHRQGRKEQRDMIKRNIDQLLVEDKENQTAWLNLGNGGYWWYWYGSEYEAQAWYLKLLSATEPKGTRASGLVKYLLNNRKHATYWNSTRDTSLCIEAMADYLRASGESKPDMTVELVVNGKKLKEEKVTGENMFSFDNRLVLAGDALPAGKHTLEVRRKGTGPVYFNTYLTNFTLENYIKRTGLEVKVRRKIFKLEREDKTTKVAGSRGQALDQRVEKYKRHELADLATLKSGDLVEVELEIESKNEYEYLMIEDMKAAGFEAVDLRSGYVWNSLGAYRELRDERVTFFVRQLARGKHNLSYRLRAEIPGKFSALPAKISAMYAPELKGNSDEIKLQIVD